MRRYALVISLVACVVAPDLVSAQTSMAAAGWVLRPEWSVERGRGGRSHIVGYLYNESPTMDAANVLLRVERLGPGGQVDATYLGRVAGDVLQGSRLAFDVPVDGPASSYRVVVESVEWVRECR
jgi:hypothetical protein